MLSPFVLVVFSRVDAALRRDGVGASGAVLIAEAIDVVALFRKARRRARARKTAAYHDYAVLSAVRRFTSFA